MKHEDTKQARRVLDNHGDIVLNLSESSSWDMKCANPKTQGKHINQN